jgi:hypothetical protein
MWHIIKLTFWLFAASGSLLFVAWCVLCALFSKVNRIDRYQRRHPARNSRVGGAVNPDLPNN